MTIHSEYLSGSVLLVAPHPDDVAYSCGGLVERHLQHREAVMLTVFGRSAWALPKPLRARGWEVVSRVRAEEDLGYGRDRGIDVRGCDLADASLRGYDTELDAHPDDDPISDEVYERVVGMLDRLRPDVVIAPAAVGGHIDHLLVHQAVRAAGVSKTLYYEDIPYSAHHDLSEVERQLTVERGLQPALMVEIADVTEAKVVGMWQYVSQTDQECVKEMLAHAHRIQPNTATERYWVAL
jgi:LmbE family N-acetylglucosaminyl deacetylase